LLICNAKDVLRCAAQASAFAITFRLDKKDSAEKEDNTAHHGGAVERCCFYTSTDAPSVKEVECIREFVKEFQLPTRVEEPMRARGFVGNSFGLNGHYNKLEFDYNHHYFEFLADLVEFSLSE